MKRLTAWSLPALLLLMVVGCSKDTNLTGPVANDHQQKAVQASPKIEWEPSQYADPAHSKPYLRSYPAPVKKSGLRSVAAIPPIVTNGDFETGDFSGWSIWLNRDAMRDPVTGDFHPEWAWFVDDIDPRGSNSAIYGPMLHTDPMAHSGTYGASAVENLGGVDHRLYQTVDLPSGGTLTVSFWLRWKNRYGGTPKWFDGAQNIYVTLRDPVTEAVLDVVYSAAVEQPAPFSGGGNINSANYEQRSADITAFAGQTVELDFTTNAHASALYVDFDDIEIVQAVTNHPPVANAGPDQIVECTGPSGTSVTLDGSGSTDEDNDPLTYSWTWAGGSASGEKPTVTLPMGSHEITLTVDDGQGGTATDVVEVDVVDTTPPVISNVSATPDAIWPPNHKMVTVTVSVNASDVCSDVVNEIVGVTNSEADNGLGDGNTVDDVQNINGLSVDLRAERSGKGNGRIYTITVRSTDASGNYTEQTVDVTVADNKGKKH